jgi:DNA repair photolyase
LKANIRSYTLKTTMPRDFIETNVKSVMNKVTGMPFRWSINPYRGCSHACVFCLAADTPILMADGTIKPLEEILIGDRVYGTVRRGAFRRFVHTFVLAHWRVEKPAFRITLEDGTELIASGDHRFFTDRGWKFVTGSGQGPMRRPHLTTKSKLMGTGTFAMPPSATVDYKRGYLCGLIRGDGLLRFYEYERKGRIHGNQYQFRLALTDEEALQRAQRYLASFSVQTHRFVFQEATARVKSMRAIRTHARSHFEQIERIVSWPAEPPLEWCNGFLAGIFDAEGWHCRGILRIANTNPVIVSFIERCLKRLGFSFTAEFRTPDQVKPLKVIRILGGLREHLRFFHSVDPAIARKRDIEGQAITSKCRLQVAAIEPLGVRRLFDITTGTGDFIANGVVTHNCYARRTHWFLDEDGIDEWSSKIFVKVNAPEVLRRELSRPSWKREEIAVGTATDPYQAIEGKYRLTRQILQALRDFRTPASIVTRSPMIQRDLDVLTDLARRAGLTVCVSIATVDAAVAHEIEPTVAPPAQRLETVRALTSAGIRAAVLLAPILPGITDSPESIGAVVEAARDNGAHFLGHNVLHLGQVTRDAFFKYLRQRRPHLVRRYEQMYRGKYAPGAYRRVVSRIVAEHKERARIVEARYLQPPKGPEQLSLLAPTEDRASEADL